MGPLVVLFVLILTVSSPTMACKCESCKDVFDNFSQCSGFIEGLCSDPSPLCYQKLANLNVIAKQENGGPMRICKCIEDFAMYKAHHPFITSRIQELPLKCNTHLSFPISECMDCSRYVEHLECLIANASSCILDIQIFNMYLNCLDMF
ncbi:hypothetical protein Pfo_013869, partial [Paulownia fortunei]